MSHNHNSETKIIIMPPAVERPIPSTISVALETNASLQSELQRLLLKIKYKKARNRREASRVMMYCQNEDDHSMRFFSSSTTSGNKYASITDINNSRKREKSSALVVIDNIEASKATIECIPRKKSKLACNSNRKEMRRFFMDKDGSTPESITGMGRGDVIRQPTTVIFERNHQSHDISAEKEMTKMSRNKSKRSTWKGNSLEAISIKIVNTPPRLVENVENCLVPIFSFADSKSSGTKFTNRECSFIMSMIRMEGGDKQMPIDWHNFAIKHCEKINQHSPWRCFCLFRSSLQHQLPWSPDEDELLLKYLAAHGPQYLLQRDCAVQTCRNLFPNRSTKQVILRAQSSLINPNYVQNSWDTNEKRKLALLVRAYSNEPNPINSVSRAFHFPHRASKSVAEKWINTLNPEMHHRFP